MKRNMFNRAVCVATACIGLLATTTAFAQSESGKAGTTITFDADNATGLYTKQAYGETIETQPFAYMKHNIAPVQIAVSNEAALTNDGTGIFAGFANNILFAQNETRITYMHGSYGTTYWAVIAPKGYRFTYYNWDIDGTASYEGTSICQYIYENGEVKTLGDSCNVNSKESHFVWSNSLNDNTNILYFRISASKNVNVFINKLTFAYSIDTPFSGQIPASDGSPDISTGHLALGEFGNNGFGSSQGANSGKGYWGFNKEGITDTQTATIYQGSTAITPDVVTVDGGQYYVAASDGDYYVEAPQKFRIVGATLNFLRREDKVLTPAETKITETVVDNIDSGNEYIIGDGNGHYLNLNNSSISSGTDAATATKWTVTASGSGYTIQSGGYYLYLKENKTESFLGYLISHTFGVTNSSSNATVWDYYNGFYSTVTEREAFSSEKSVTYYISYSNGFDKSTSASSAAKPLFVEITVIPETSLSADFTAKAFNRDNSGSQDKKLVSGDDAYTVELPNLNNDAIHFSISDLAEGQSALYNVNLQLMPLNPELQNLSVASIADGDEFKNTTSFTPTNYVFNDGEAMTIIVPSTYKGTSSTVKFVDAYNEEGTAWYNNGTDGYSNYFLVNSTADKGESDAVNLDAEATPAPDARTSATQAGTNPLAFTNIKDIYNTNLANPVEGGPAYLIDNEFKKTEAGYKDATITVGGDPMSYYVYSADMPTYNILEKAGINSKQHIDFRYYTLNLQCIKQEEEPDITITPIYTETLKSQNHKNTSIASDGSTLNSNVTFFGATVKAKLANGENADVNGYLTSQQVVDGIKEAVKAYAETHDDFKYNENDVLRGMLFADLTNLSRTDNKAYTDEFHSTTADNCLYFMYEGFSQANLDNVVVKTKNGTLESASNVKLYDQQPFFSPYDFNTAQFKVTYDREGTVDNGNGVKEKEKVKKMAVVLPFDVSLDGNGKLKTASDVTDNSVTYHNITGSGEVEGTVNGQPRTYAVVASVVESNKAEANKPYYVETTSDGFTYNISGAQFRKSGTIENNVVTNKDELANATEGTWQSTGTYAGITPAKAEGLWYFAKNLFWHSAKLENFSVVNIRPFRAYFTTNDNTPAQSARVVYSLDDIVTGIGSVTVGGSKALDITVGYGQINVTANAATQLQIHTLAGQLVAKGRLDNGESRSVNVPQGIYIVNNVKVVVK